MIIAIFGVVCVGKTTIGTMSPKCSAKQRAETMCCNGLMVWAGVKGKYLINDFCKYCYIACCRKILLDSIYMLVYTVIGGD